MIITSGCCEIGSVTSDCSKIDIGLMLIKKGTGFENSRGIGEINMK